jgi:hypothetical protein
LLPLLAGHRLLAPTDAPILANLPDAPPVADPDLARSCPEMGESARIQERIST